MLERRELKSMIEKGVSLVRGRVSWRSEKERHWTELAQDDNNSGNSGQHSTMASFDFSNKIKTQAVCPLGDAQGSEKQDNNRRQDKGKVHDETWARAARRKI